MNSRHANIVTNFMFIKSFNYSTRKNTTLRMTNKVITISKEGSVFSNRISNKPFNIINLSPKILIMSKYIK